MRTTRVTLLQLKKYIEAGSLIVTVFRDCSTSGMSRYYDVYALIDGELLRYTGTVSNECGCTYNRNREALVVKGYGFNGADDIIESLARELKIDKQSIKHQGI
jgi:hypothetical protein